MNENCKMKIADLYSKYETALERLNPAMKILDIYVRLNGKSEEPDTDTVAYLDKLAQNFRDADLELMQVQQDVANFVKECDVPVSDEYAWIMDSPRNINLAFIHYIKYKEALHSNQDEL